MGRKGKNLSDALWSELEKLDVLRERIGIGYEEAREALNFAQGDIMKALDNLEKVRRIEEGEVQEEECCWEDKGAGIWDGVKSTISNISNSTISLKRDKNTMVTLSAPLGLALAYTIWRKPGLRMIALVGAVGAAMNHFELEVASNVKHSYNDDAFNFDADGLDEVY